MLIFVFLKTFRLSSFHFFEPQFWSVRLLSLSLCRSRTQVYGIFRIDCNIYTTIFFSFSYRMWAVYLRSFCVRIDLDEMPLKIGKYLQTLEMLSMQFNIYRFYVFFFWIKIHSHHEFFFPSLTLSCRCSLSLSHPLCIDFNDLGFGKRSFNQTNLNSTKKKNEKLSPKKRENG